MNAATAAGMITLRSATGADDPFLRELFETSKPHLQHLPLPEEQRRQLIDMQWNAQRSSYAAAYPAADHLIIELDGRKVGRLVRHISGPTAIVVDVAIAPADRNHGIGTAVLADVIDHAATTQLHVAADNPARRLYERLGFRVREQSGLDLAMEANPPAAPSESP